MIENAPQRLTGEQKAAIVARTLKQPSGSLQNNSTVITELTCSADYSGPCHIYFTYRSPGLRRLIAKCFSPWPVSMRHYHVLVEFSEPMGHARAFAHISESQVRHHFILPWTQRDTPIGPDRDVMASQVARLRIFRATGPGELGPMNRASAKDIGQDVTDLFLSEVGARAKPPVARRPLLFAVGAAVVAGTLALLRLRKSAGESVSRRGASGAPNRHRVSPV